MKIIVFVTISFLLLLLSWYIHHLFITGSNPFIFLFAVASAFVLLGYMILIISRIEEKKTKWYLILMMTATILIITYASWKYYFSDTGMPKRYFDIKR